MNSALSVLDGGVLSLLTDSGRKGTHHQGLTSGGPMDEEAFYWANRLVSNAIGATCIEITMGGLVVKAQRDCQVAVTGALMPLEVNGVANSLYRSFTLNAGDELRLGMCEKGMRCYLAIAGGFVAPEQFGSTTTVPRERLGGLHQNGQGLKAGDILNCAGPETTGNVELDKAHRPEFADIIRLRVVTGYQYRDFAAVATTRFFSQAYTVTDRMDRMGIRLAGKAVESGVSGLVSEGICHGAVQLPPDGQPIIMMNDRQTIGGYPKLGSVLGIDCNLLAQARPGTRIYFDEIDMFTAHNLIQKYHYRRMRTALVACD